jgi:hypothetical protein
MRSVSFSLQAGVRKDGNKKGLSKAVFSLIAAEGGEAY